MAKKKIQLLSYLRLSSCWLISAFRIESRVSNSVLAYITIHVNSTYLSKCISYFSHHSKWDASHSLHIPFIFKSVIFHSFAIITPTHHGCKITQTSSAILITHSMKNFQHFPIRNDYFLSVNYGSTTCFYVLFYILFHPIFCHNCLDASSSPFVDHKILHIQTASLII